MVDCDRLQANAEDAQVSSEAARTRLLMAQASLRDRTARWHEAQERRAGGATETQPLTSRRPTRLPAR